MNSSILYFPSIIIKKPNICKTINFVKYEMKVSDDSNTITIQVYVDISYSDAEEKKKASFEGPSEGPHGEIIFHKDSEYIELSQLFPPRMRIGLGSWILYKLLEEIKNYILDTSIPIELNTNNDSLEFYEKLGFEIKNDKRVDDDDTRFCIDMISYFDETYNFLQDKY